MNLTDKITLLFFEPFSLFERFKERKIKILDWFIPILIYIIFSSASDIIISSDATIRQLAFEKRISKVEKQIEKSIQNQSLSQAEANKIFDEEYEKARFFSSTPGLVWSFISKFVFTFVIFFIGVLLMLFIFNSTLAEIYKFEKLVIAFGLPFYILAFESILQIILALIFKQDFSSISLSEFIPSGDGYFAFIFGFINPFKIWYLMLVSAGLYKLHNARKFYKYPLMFFVLISGLLSVFYYFFNQYFSLYNNISGSM